MTAPQQPGDQDWQPTPYPTEMVSRMRAELAEEIRRIDNDIADLQAARVRLASVLQAYGVAAEVLASYDATVQADRRAQWEDDGVVDVGIVDDDEEYAPCTEERAS